MRKTKMLKKKINGYKLFDLWQVVKIVASSIKVSLVRSEQSWIKARKINEYKLFDLRKITKIVASSIKVRSLVRSEQSWIKARKFLESYLRKRVDF